MDEGVAEWAMYRRHVMATLQAVDCCGGGGGDVSVALPAVIAAMVWDYVHGLIVIEPDF
jgi:hypothetical protein